MITGVKVGDVIGDRYRVEQVLGSGAMGVVVAARHIQLDDPVAIKFLAPELLESPSARGRFDREARAAARIKHEHVIRVYDVGKLASGVPYLVMEHLTGCDLATLLHNDGPLRLEQAIDFVRQACSGIAEAHRLGVVHRDIKPSNLFCTRRPDQRLTVKVLDFGISKLVELAPNGSITGSTSLLGSPSYMSPEQMRAPSRVDHRTDIWSLGVVLYELSTGALPFEGSTYAELCLSVTTDVPEPPRARCPGLPAELEAILLKCLEKNRDNRYANVAELEQALEAFVSQDEHSSHRPALATSNASSPPTLTAASLPVEAPALPQLATSGKSTWAQTVAPLATLPRRHPLVFAGVLVVVVAGVALAWRGATAPEPASAARSLEPPGPVRAAEAPAPGHAVASPAPARPAPAPSAVAPSSKAASVSATPRTPAAPASVSIRALRTAPLASPSAPAATPPVRPAKPRTTAVPVQRSRSSVWTERE